MLECDWPHCSHCLFAPQWMPDSRPNRPQFCFARLLIHLVGEWASNHTPGGLLGERMGSEPCSGQVMNLNIASNFGVCVRAECTNRILLTIVSAKFLQFWLVNLTTSRAGSAPYSYISVQLQRQLFERTNPVHRLTPCIRIFSTPFLIIYNVSRTITSRF